MVLVRPAGPVNVGATARALTNMGIRDLVLVQPHVDPQHEEALAYAARGKAILENARSAATISDALSGTVLSFALTGKGGMYRSRVAINPAEAAELGVRTAQAEGPVAFVLGPEDRGLLLEELLLFDRIVEIPADSAYPVLNLGAAAMVMAYELRKAALATTERPAPPRPPAATDDQRARMYDALFEGMRVLGFFRRHANEDHLKYAIRHLLGRTTLSADETDILFGLGRQMQWYAAHHRTYSENADDPR